MPCDRKLQAEAILPTLRPKDLASLAWVLGRAEWGAAVECLEMLFVFHVSVLMYIQGY